MRHFRSTFRACAAILLLGAFSLAAPVPVAAQDGDRVLRLESIEASAGESAGESAHLAAVLADRLDLQPGDRIDAESLITARRELVLSGWFEDVEVYTRRGSAPGAVVLHVEGTLDRGPRFETGFAHDPLDGWTLNVVGLRAHHLLGPGSSLSAGWKLGQRRGTGEIDFVAPRIRGLDFDLLLRASAGRYQWNAFDGESLYQQKIDRSALYLGARWHLRRDLTTTVWVGGSAADPQGFDFPEEPSTIDRNALDLFDTERVSYGDLGLDLTLDRRDRTEPWRRGVWSTLQLRAQTPRSGPQEDLTFGRARFALRGALPLPAQNSLAARVDATWTDRATPYHLRPIFGGQSTVRGFRDASLSGFEGARGIFATALEWRAPLLPRAGRDARVHGALFVDTGTFVDAEGQSQDWATSVGWGVRVRVPWIERLSLDMAVPLTPSPTDDAFWVHGSLGFGF